MYNIRWFELLVSASLFALVSLSCGGTQPQTESAKGEDDEDDFVTSIVGEIDESELAEEGVREPLVRRLLRGFGRDHPELGPSGQASRNRSRRARGTSLSGIRISLTASVTPWRSPTGSTNVIRM